VDLIGLNAGSCIARTAAHGCAAVSGITLVCAKVAAMGKLWIADTNGCWIDVWDMPAFTGHHRRLIGAADFPYLRIAEQGWNPNVQSLIAGPNAYAQFYEDLNFHDSVFWVLPNQRVENVADLGCNEEIDSLRIYDRPPFAHEPGYAAYMLWAASHLMRATKAEQE
jgi:hypothetical protein